MKQRHKSKKHNILILWFFLYVTRFKSISFQYKCTKTHGEGENSDILKAENPYPGSWKTEEFEYGIFSKTLIGFGIDLYRKQALTFADLQ